MQLVKVSAIGAEVLNQLYLRREGDSGVFLDKSSRALPAALASVRIRPPSLTLVYFRKVRFFLWCAVVGAALP